jgi:hypothetical protein
MEEKMVPKNLRTAKNLAHIEMVQRTLIVALLGSTEVTAIDVDKI